MRRRCVAPYASPSHSPSQRSLDRACVASFVEVDGEEDLTLLASRVKNFELSLTGPLPGTRAALAGLEPGRMEREALARECSDPDQLEPGVPGLSLPGTRRALRVPLQNLARTWQPEGLRLQFELPAGSYATVLVAELAKNPNLR